MRLFTRIFINIFFLSISCWIFQIGTTQQNKLLARHDQNFKPKSIYVFIFNSLTSPCKLSHRLYIYLKKRSCCTSQTLFSRRSHSPTPSFENWHRESKATQKQFHPSLLWFENELSTPSGLRAKAAVSAPSFYARHFHVSQNSFFCEPFKTLNHADKMPPPLLPTYQNNIPNSLLSISVFS